MRGQSNSSNISVKVRTRCIAGKPATSEVSADGGEIAGHGRSPPWDICSDRQRHVAHHVGFVEEYGVLQCSAVIIDGGVQEPVYKRPLALVNISDCLPSTHDDLRNCGLPESQNYV